MMFVVALSQGIKETQAELSLCTLCYCQIRQNSWSSTGHILVHLQTVRAGKHGVCESGYVIGEWE